MLKALFLDLDETLCDTLGANKQAKQLMAQSIEAQYGENIKGEIFSNKYVAGIYREWTYEQRVRYMPIIERQGEERFRLQLIRDLLAELGVDNVKDEIALAFQDQFDRDRLMAFDFYPGIVDFLIEARKLFTIVVITNGPEFSQVPKIERVGLAKYVDHIIVGGQEPEQKPASSIFNKALKLANCQADEAVHVGDSLATDIAGAHNCGITSVWIKHQQPLDSELGINPHHILFHPCEIQALIYQLHQD